MAPAAGSAAGGAGRYVPSLGPSTGDCLGWCRYLEDKQSGGFDWNDRAVVSIKATAYLFLSAFLRSVVEANRGGAQRLHPGDASNCSGESAFFQVSKDKECY